MRISIYSLALLFFATTLFTSCTKDDTVETDPTISFKTGGNYTSSAVTIEKGSSINIGILALPSTTSKKNLTNFKLTGTTNNTPTTIIDSTFSNDSFNADYLITFETIGETNLIAEISDKNGKSVSTSFVVTVIDASEPVNKHLDISLGSFNDTEFGSFYSTSTNEVFFSNVAIDNQTIIDFEFYLGATDGPTIASPADENAYTVFRVLRDAAWVTKNNTKFMAATISVDDFDAISDSYTFPDFTGEATSMINLETNNILYFKTAEGKTGFIKINNVNGRGDKANIDVIVAQ